MFIIINLNIFTYNSSLNDWKSFDFLNQTIIGLIYFEWKELVQSL